MMIKPWTVIQFMWHQIRHLWKVHIPIFNVAKGWLYCADQTQLYLMQRKILDAMVLIVVWLVQIFCNSTLFT